MFKIKYLTTHMCWLALNRSDTDTAEYLYTITAGRRAQLLCCETIYFKLLCNGLSDMGLIPGHTS